MSIGLQHQETVNKYFEISFKNDLIWIVGTYEITTEDLTITILVADCCVCGAVVRVGRALSHCIWHESLEYKKDAE